MERVTNLCKQHPYITVFLIAFIPRLFFMLGISTMSISGDEIFSFWPAAKIAGYNWSGVMEQYRYYGIGYTLLLVPFFKFIRNPVVLYRTLVILMVLFQSLCAPICCHLLRRFFHISKNSLLILPSIAVSYMIPMRAVYTYPEFLYDLLIWIIIWIMLKLSIVTEKKEKLGFTILLWVITAYTCTVHTRGVTVICAIVLSALIYQTITKKRLLNWPATIMLAAFALVFYKVGINLLMQFLDVQHSVQNTTVSVGSSVIHLLLKQPKSWMSFIAIIVGQFNEAIMMSFGLAVPVTWAFARIGFSKKYWTHDNYPALIVGWFCIVSLIITIGGHAIGQTPAVYEAMFKNGNWDAFRSVTYGRYFAAYAAPFLMVGLYLLYGEEMRKSILRPALITSGILQLYFVINIIPYINHFNGSVWSYAPFFLTRGFVDNISTAAYLTGTFFVFGLQVLYFWLSEKNKTQWILLIVCGGLLYIYGFNCFYHEGYRSKQNMEMTETGINYLRTIPKDTYIYVENVPAGTGGQGIAWLYQFAMPDQPIEIYSKDVPSEENVVIVTSNENDQTLIDEGFKLKKIGGGWYVYEKTGENS